MTLQEVGLWMVLLSVTPACTKATSGTSEPPLQSVPQAPPESIAPTPLVKVYVVSSFAKADGREEEADPEPLVYGLDQHRQELAKCFTGAGQGERVELSFTWTNQSKLEEVAILKSDLRGTPAFETCMVKTVSSWGMPVPAANVPARATFQFGGQDPAKARAEASAQPPNDPSLLVTPDLVVRERKGRCNEDAIGGVILQRLGPKTYEFRTMGAKYIARLGEDGKTLMYYSSVSDGRLIGFQTILETTRTTFSNAGDFEVCIKKTYTTRDLPMRNGFLRKMRVLKEDDAGPLTPQGDF